MMEVDKRRSDCPISLALEVFGDRWTLLVVRDLALGHLKHFGEFLDSGEGISSNILADRLDRLERTGLVTSRTDPDSARRKIYDLTAAGLDLIPVILGIIRWSAAHDSQTSVSEEMRRQLNDEFEELATELRSKAAASAVRDT